MPSQVDNDQILPVSHTCFFSVRDTSVHMCGACALSVCDCCLCWLTSILVCFALWLCSLCQLELPRYSSLKVMREKLLYSIANCMAIDADTVADNLDWNAEE
jgi:hypothetical protein